MKTAIVIGAGLGGLSSAIRLASSGYKVTVLEQQHKVGGKLQRIESQGYHFDRGPSTITMPQAFARVFASSGRRMEDYLDLYRLDPYTRNFFADGSVVDMTSNMGLLKDQIALYSPDDAANLDAFMKDSKAMFQQADTHFLNKLMLDTKSKLSPALISAFLKIRPLTTLQQQLHRYFSHANTLAMFGRYATYVGASPYKAPAIFAMMAHLEGYAGVYGVKGGTYAIPAAFEKVAQELGVDIRTGVAVHTLLFSGDRVTGVECDDGSIYADVIVVNGDVLTACKNLIPESKRPGMRDSRIQAYEPSLSGFVALIGVRQKYRKLLHHNVFFPEQYAAEFHDIFVKRRPPSDPTVYICHSGYSEPSMAPEGGSNLFVLINAPYTSSAWSWDQGRDAYKAQLMSRLHTLGIYGAEEAEVQQIYTPEDLQKDTGAYRGAIYGISSNSARQTFARPSNRLKGLNNLWFVGGTTNPGGGTPIVTLSGQLVADEIIRRG
ncbi:phytoene desaturase [Paenibacillus lemnae]|uniref:4,4'-diaponeurosporene oxygenase n=2 Tax=Paenibacillus lemnae TaxID=1330551 RepID=A0A848M7S0_PAELE|nr:phytoene desaturase family protein [Paenibacillus lemnae]NMO97057.1 phytoene desaturase [Paenibacillus lemnae]